MRVRPEDCPVLAPRATVCALNPWETCPWKRGLAFRGPCGLGFPWFFDHVEKNLQKQKELHMEPGGLRKPDRKSVV